MSLQLSERTIGDVVIIDLSGKITLGDGGDVMLKDKVRSLLQQGRKKLIMNLGDVSYVDSAGLGELVRAHSATKNGGGELKLFNLTRRLRDLMVLTALAKVIETCETEAQALASFGPQPA